MQLISHIRKTAAILNKIDNITLRIDAKMFWIFIKLNNSLIFSYVKYVCKLNKKLISSKNIAKIVDKEIYFH
jgi:hypothetical protein